MCTATKIPLMYSFSGNSAASAPISTFMCLWAIYIVPGSVYIFPPTEWADRLWENINHSQTHECGNWDWDPDIPFLGIFVSKFRFFVFAVCQDTIHQEPDPHRTKNWIWIDIHQLLILITTKICKSVTMLEKVTSSVELMPNYFFILYSAGEERDGVWTYPVLCCVQAHECALHKGNC